jgi:hypothetical protein
MASERWCQVEKLYHAVQARPAHERAVHEPIPLETATAAKNLADLARIAKDAKAKADAAALAKADYDQGVKDGDAYCERLHSGISEAAPFLDKFSASYQSGWKDGNTTCENRYRKVPPPATVVPSHGTWGYPARSGTTRMPYSSPIR